MQSLDTIHDYLTSHSEEIGARILSSYPALHGADEAPSPLLSRMVRVPYPAQTLAIMGVSKRWQLARNANVVAECGAGKTLIALGSMLVHSSGRQFSGLVMAPPHLVEKWARETFLTLPQVRVFLIDDMRNGGDPKEPHGINEVRLRRGEIVREGLHTSLPELRRLGRKGWRRLCPGTAIFCIGREKAKLSYFWKHCYGKSRSGRYLGSLTNPDTGCPVETDGVRLSALDFEKKRLHEIVEDSKAGRPSIPRSGRRTATRLLAWRPPNTWDATCRNGGTTRLRTKSINWPATRPRAMHWECSTKRHDGFWG